MPIDWSIIQDLILTKDYYTGENKGHNTGVKVMTAGYYVSHSNAHHDTVYYFASGSGSKP